MEGDAVDHDSKDSSGCTSYNLDVMGIDRSVKQLPLLCTETGVNVEWTAKDLFVCDQQCSNCIGGLLNLLEDEDVEFCSGISNGCVLLASHECRFAWILRQSSSQYNAGDGHLGGGHISLFHWCIIPDKFRQLVESYLKCKALHMENINSISAAVDNTQCVFISAEIVKLNLVMAVERDLELLTIHRFYMSVDNIVDSAKCGDICSLPNFPQFVFQITHASQMTGRSIETCSSSVVCRMQANFSINARTHLEEMSLSIDATTSNVAADVDVYDNDLKCLKMEEDTDEQEDEERKQQHSQHTLQVTQRISKTSFKGKYKKLVEVAKTYANLNCTRGHDEAAHPFPPRQNTGRKIIIECPRCNTPCNSASSAFLKLLRHVLRRHPHYLHSLVVDIITRYGPFIEFMKRKIELRARRQYVKKLRNLGRRKNLLN